MEGLTVDRGERRVLEDVTFRVAAGAALVLTGPNGAGKSTLIGALAGLTPLIAGTIQLEMWERERQSAIHLVGHLNALKPQLTARENTLFWCRWFDGGAAWSGASAAPSGTGTAHTDAGAASSQAGSLASGADAGDHDERAEAALAAVDLLHLAEAPAQFLSQGQRRRLAIARVLAAPRPVWLLDEPTAGLDTASRATLTRLMEAHLAKGGIIVAATHEPLGLDGATTHRLASRRPDAAAEDDRALEGA